jgi:hypothetical protein
MEKRIGGLLLILAVATFAFAPVNADAVDQGFYSVNIKFVGPMFGETLMMVDAADGSFTSLWLKLDSANQNMLLATALTAVSLNKPVKIWVLTGTQNFAGVSCQICYAVQMDLSGN